jgi:hypothetical protein
MIKVRAFLDLDHVFYSWGKIDCNIVYDVNHSILIETVISAGENISIINVFFDQISFSIIQIYDKRERN